MVQRSFVWTFSLTKIKFVQAKLNFSQRMSSVQLLRISSTVHMFRLEIIHYSLWLTCNMRLFWHLMVKNSFKSAPVDWLSSLMLLMTSVCFIRMVSWKSFLKCKLLMSYVINCALYNPGCFHCPTQAVIRSWERPCLDGFYTNCLDDC